MKELDLEKLRQEIGELEELCQNLARENLIMRNRLGVWQDERRRLMENNRTAREKIERLVTELKIESNGLH